MVWNSMMDYLKSWFNYPGVEAKILLLCAGLALAFGIIWLLAHRPPFFKKPALWLVAIGSALITVVATAFIYFPLNYYYTQWLDSTFSSGTLIDTMLLWTIPIVLVAGLVQEGAKMIPMLFWWMGSYKPTPRMGMMIGAASGGGYGIFLAFSTHCQIFSAGWTWDYVSAGGVEALVPFWQMFWLVAAHIAISAIVGYGLAKGKGGRFYLLAALLHAVIAYLTILYSKELITYNQMGIIIAIAGAIIMAISLILRWRKRDEDTPYLPGSPKIEPPIPEPPASDKPTMV